MTMAVTVQLMVDFMLTRETAEQAAVDELQGLLDWVFLGRGGKLSCLQAVLTNDLPALQEALNQAKGCLASAKALAVEADPKLKMIGGPYTDFNITLYQKAIGTLESCMASLMLFLMASKTWAANESVMDIEEDAENPAMCQPAPDEESCPTCAPPPDVLQVVVESTLVASLKDKILKNAALISEAIKAILEHRKEGKLEHRTVEELQASALISAEFTQSDLERFWTEVGERLPVDTEKKELTNSFQTRVVVASRALVHLIDQLADLHSLCLRNI